MIINILLNDIKKCNKGTKEWNETAAQNGAPFSVFSTFKTKIATVEKQLWDKLGRFGFDSEGTQLTFAKRLARENGWNAYYTGRVIEEYKKFIFLCCVSPTPVTPSDPVDQAWHLHLTYTKSYWESLCENTLGRKIHHNPTKGGKNEQEKFDGCYTTLREIYAEKFGTPPPPDIWQDNDERFSKINFQRVSLDKYWLVPKPDRAFWDIAAQSLLVIGALLCIQASPGNICIIIFVIAFIILAVCNRNNRGGANDAGCTSGDSHGHSGCSSHGDSGCSSGCSGCSGCGGCGGGD